MNLSTRPDQISVVMATYQGETASNLRQAINSILEQTRSPGEFVIVGDGPLPDEQLQVIEDAIARANFPVRFLQLDENVGRGRARNLGIEACSFGWIALMDSDDISLPNRLSAQAGFLEQHEDVDVLAALTVEFDEEDTSGQRGTVKSCPQSHADIHKALRLSNCVANPTLLFRKALWSRVGGFPDFREINEDYLFYFRLIAAGAKFACLPLVLLKVRIGNQQRLRRKGLKVFISDARFRLALYRERHLGLGWTFFPLMLIGVRRMLPPYFDKFAQALWRRVSHAIH